MKAPEILPSPSPLSATQLNTSRALTSRRIGLSERLLLMTVLLSLIISAFIYIPVITTFRNIWIKDRLAEARTAALVLEVTPDENKIPAEMIQQLLDHVGARAIVLKIKDMRRLIATETMPPDVEAIYDTRESDMITNIIASYETLRASTPRIVRIIGPAPMGGDFIELIMSDEKLRKAMLRYSARALSITLIIALIAGTALYFALSYFFMRPVSRLIQNMLHFGEAPNDTRRVISPSKRQDEIGDAEHALYKMETMLGKHLRQREHLANLGLAVAKINHDLRNILSTAQLLSDRMGMMKPEDIPQFTPRLINTLGRAVHLCEATLSYGRAEEKPPKLTNFNLIPIIEDVIDALRTNVENDASANPAITTPIEITLISPKTLETQQDYEYIYRILVNLGRNAIAAMRDIKGERKLTFEVMTIDATPHKAKIRTTSPPVITSAIKINIIDTGPGVPAALREKLFQPFQGSDKKGSIGLGLAIASELANNLGGSLTLMDSKHGAHFQLMLPQSIHTS